MRYGLVTLFLILSMIHNAYALTAAETQRAQSLYSEFRCVVCEGQSLAESDAAIAIDMRHFIDTQIEADKTDEEIVSMLVGSYGQTILMEPPVEGEHLLVWLLPLLLLFGGGFFLYNNLRRSRDG